MCEIKFRSVAICKVLQSYALRISGLCYAATTQYYGATRPLRCAATTCRNFFRTCSTTAASDSSSLSNFYSKMKKEIFILFIEIATSLFEWSICFILRQALRKFVSAELCFSTTVKTINCIIYSEIAQEVDCSILYQHLSIIVRYRRIGGISINFQNNYRSSTKETLVESSNFCAPNKNSDSRYSNTKPEHDSGTHSRLAPPRRRPLNRKLNFNVTTVQM